MNASLEAAAGEFAMRKGDGLIGLLLLHCARSAGPFPIHFKKERETRRGKSALAAIPAAPTRPTGRLGPIISEGAGVTSA